MSCAVFLAAISPAIRAVPRISSFLLLFSWISLIGSGFEKYKTARAMAVLQEDCLWPTSAMCASSDEVRYVNPNFDVVEFDWASA